MPETIEYLCSDVPNDWYSQGRAGLAALSPRCKRCDIPPEGTEHVYAMRIGGRAQTSNMALFKEEAIRVRWGILVGDTQPPANMNLRAATAFAEAIWLAVLSKEENFIGNGTAMKQALLLEVSKQRSLQTWDGGETGWREYEESGRRAGVDLALEAWIAGSPIEAVLAE